MKHRTLHTPTYVALALAMLMAGLALCGCDSQKMSAADEQKVRDTMAGKGVKPLPASVQKQMEEAMRKGMGDHAPSAPKQ